MKIIVLAAAALLVGHLAQAATIYECTDASGRKVYTQDGGRNCMATRLGTSGRYSSAAPVTYQTASSAPNAAKTPSHASAADIDAARQALSRAQTALEEGKKVRLGNERNYTKYLERINGLENNVKAAEQKLQAAESGAAGTEEQ